MTAQPLFQFGTVTLNPAPDRRVVPSRYSLSARSGLSSTRCGLCPPQPEAFAAALAVLASDPARAERMGRAGREHVAGKFSKAAFGAKLEQIVEETVSNSRSIGLE